MVMNQYLPVRIGKKQLTREEKKYIKTDSAQLRKLIANAKPDRMSEQGLAEIRLAIQQLTASSSHARAVADESK